MPELPEVETVRRVLDSSLTGLKIVDIKIKYNPIIDSDIDDFKKNVIGKTIKSLSRRAKFLIFNLDEGHIVSHLRMEGKYFYSNENLDNKHVHVIYQLSNGYSLYYQDVRKFGRMEYKNSADLYTTPPLSDVGYDLVLDQIDSNIVYKKIHNKKLPIKTVLLDQSILAGLGNIYVDEVLFDTNICPLKEANKITLEQINSIILSANQILNHSIKEKGCTIRSYTSSLNVIGNYQNFLKVHTKSTCPHCKGILKRVKIGGRTTYYCDSCQG